MRPFWYVGYLTNLFFRALAMTAKSTALFLAACPDLCEKSNMSIWRTECLLQHWTKKNCSLSRCPNQQQSRHSCEQLARHRHRKLTRYSCKQVIRHSRPRLPRQSHQTALAMWSIFRKYIVYILLWNILISRYMVLNFNFSGSSISELFTYIEDT